MVMMMRARTLLVAVAAVVVVAAAAVQVGAEAEEGRKEEGATTTWCVVRDGATDVLSLEEGGQGQQGVCGSYSAPDFASESGWGQLTVDMDPENVGASREEMRAAYEEVGYLEGFLTCTEIEAFAANAYFGTFGKSAPDPQVMAFLKENFQWTKDTAATNSANADGALSTEEQEFWQLIDGIVAQFEGMYTGFQQGCPDSTTSWDDLLININYGDLFDVMTKFHAYSGADGTEDGRGVRPGHPRPRTGHMLTDTRCSALVRCMGDQADGTFDIAFSHVTWDTFGTASPRIMKRFNALVTQDGAQRQVSTLLSSSPGLLSASLDDFYVVLGEQRTSSLLVMETSNDVFNGTLYDALVPQSLFCWVRVIAANTLARDGSGWARLFSKDHSGSYNNQWMVLDLNVFHNAFGEASTPGSGHAATNTATDGLFWVLEELPGYIHAEDMSDFLLRNEFWPSYNVPYFQDVYEMSGYAAVCERSGPTSDCCYDTAPRANLFREHAPDVQDFDEFKLLMGSNNWETDPYSLGDPANAISARGDLETGLGKWVGGAIDGKATTAAHMNRRIESQDGGPWVQARLGPTHDEQPVFCWDQVNEAVFPTLHEGQPECYDQYVWVDI